MTLVSYAQNFEDVLLWRCFPGCEDGFYIDVGAAHPDIESVTRSFYDAGWTGVNIEPAPEYATRLRAARSRDVNLSVALAETQGSTPFYVVDGTGLSTLDHKLSLSYREAGFSVKTTTVEITTLADVCRRYAPSVIHFLKIDVEGAEAAVLAGADFTRYRPKIVLVEATAPMSTREVHGAWEPLLTAANYHFVWFDGLNRYYVAEEWHAQMAPHFRSPPNVHDNFIRVADSTLARMVAEAEGRATALQDRVGSMERKAHDEARAAAQVRQMSEVRRAEISTLKQTIAKFERDGDHFRAAVNRLEAAIAESEANRRRASLQVQWVHESTSWRLTAPLRSISRSLTALRPAPARQDKPAAPTLQAAPTIALAAPEQEVIDDGMNLPEERPQFNPPLARLASSAPTQTVHQFHSGSAVGDAITNAMLMTRTLLRSLGYHSDIFVEHCDPLLAGDLRPMDQLPRHADYILIVRLSMGFDGFDHIVGLPARKVLIYHNITPPELLVGLPEFQRYAILGRHQLSQLRPHITAALADSEYNALELRNLRFAAVETCFLLLDTAALRARSARPRTAGNVVVRDLECFTILFVGRIIESKGQRELIAGFAEFAKIFGKPTRLVLVGRSDGAGDSYSQAIDVLLHDSNLSSQVIMTGLISDDERDDWYRHSQLYVSLSRHEGFGLPLIEAMAFGIPVLAFAAAAVPYTLAGGGTLLNTTDAGEVAQAMLTLARDPSRREAIVAAQQRALDRFELRREVPKLVNALIVAGAAPPGLPETRPLLAKNARFTIVGHFSGHYSLAAVNRSLVGSLEATRPGTVRVAAVETHPTEEVHDAPPGELALMRDLLRRPPHTTGPHIVISHHYPVYVPEQQGDCMIALFFWEESVVPEDVVATLNRSFQGIFAPTVFVAKTLIDSGVMLPIRVVGAPPLAKAFRARRAIKVAPKRPFTFVHVSSCFPRKGVDVLLKAYAAAFRREDNVRLIIKGFPNPHNDVEAQIASLRRSTPNPAAITFINSDMTETQIAELYAEADVVVLPTRGEGFNLVAAEAMAAGIPLIITGFGGHMDFCGPANVRFLDYSFARSASHLATAHSIWVEPDVQDLVLAMREATSGEAPVRPDPIDDRAFIKGLLTRAIDILLSGNRTPIRIGWISTWDVRCGIAEYARKLVDNMPASPFVESLLVLCDDRTEPMPTGSQSISVQPAWGVAQPNSIPRLEQAVHAADPHVLVVQHQPGLMPWPMLTAFLRSSAACGRITIVTLHNTAHILEVESTVRAAAVTSLAGVARIVVHTIADLNRLKMLGLVNNVVMLPHGAGPPADLKEPRLKTPATPLLLGCYGFFLPGKGIPELIDAVASLRQRWPGLRLRLVNADYGSAESQAEIASCRQQAETLGLSKSIDWQTDFLSDSHSARLLSECDLVVLPYRESKEASSASLRAALTAGTPVAVTPIALFDEASDTVFRFPGLASADIADGLGQLLGDGERLLALQHATRKWLRDRAWPTIAKRFQGMLLGLSAAELSRGGVSDDDAPSEQISSDAVGIQQRRTA